MKRRIFIRLAATALAPPLSAAGQPLPVIGFLSSRSPKESAPHVAGFRRGLQEGLCRRPERHHRVALRGG
jgi:putative ABC transport system substrate-binding protein